MIDDDENDRRKNEMLWKEKRRMKKKKKGRDEIEKDVDDKVMIWGSEKYVAWLQKTQINSIFLFMGKQNKQTQTEKNEN